MKLTVNCMCRNEEATIFEALISAGQVADEIVVVDTGSTDGTLEVVEEARKYLNKPFIVEQAADIPDLTGWSYQGGSFLPSFKLADIRNRMIALSTGDSVWVVDADEIYTDRDAQTVA